MLPIALLLLSLSAAPEDPLMVAHKAGDHAHVLSVFRVESAIESMNSGTVQVFGKRRDLLCPGGAQVTESACNPCQYESKDWAERPAEQWLAEVSWPVGDEAAHERAMNELAHFRRYFDLQPRGGTEKGGKRYAFVEMISARPILPEEPEVTMLRLYAAGKETVLALIPAGAHDVEIEAKALSKNGAGALAEAPDAKFRFESACAAIVPTGDRTAKVAINRGSERCEVKVASVKGNATASIVVRREVQLFVTYDGQRADDLVLDGANVVELSFEVEPKGGVARVAPQWKVEGGTFELLDGGKGVKVRLSEKGEARVLLEDDESGAAAQASVRRKAK